MSDDDFDPDEHCRHCSPDCEGRSVSSRLLYLHFSSHGEEWYDCPACAAERHARSICQQQAVRAIEAADLTGNWAGALIGLHSLIRSSEWDDLTAPILDDDEIDAATEMGQ